jgi:hypothetical protein
LPVDDPSNDQAREQWFQHFQFAESEPMETVLGTFLPELGTDNPQYLLQLRTNFDHLCSVWRDPESLMKGTVSLKTFISFFRCFGSPIGIREQLEEITVQDSEAFSATNPCFIDGICIGFGKSLLAARWATASPETWMLIEGEQEGTFRLLTRSRQADMDQDRCRTIWIDTTNLEQRLGFKLEEDGEMIHVANLSDLLTSLQLVKYAGLQVGNMDIVRHSSTSLEQGSDRFEDWGFTNGGQFFADE